MGQVFPLRVGLNFEELRGNRVHFILLAGVSSLAWARELLSVTYLELR